MNFFFGVKSKIFYSELQVPMFQNRDPKKKDINLYEAYIKNNKWKISNISSNYSHHDFYLLDKNVINNKKFFFLANSTDLQNFNSNELIDLNKYTNTSPDFRSNFKINIINGGFSSYQSEYPYEMTKKKGLIISQINSLANTDAQRNYLIFRNIYYLPIEQNFNGYFINYKNKKIVDKFQLKTNRTNIIEISSSLIKPEIFFTTNEYLGVPIYLSEKKGHLSFEHTHPPHEYILGKNKFEIISNLKKEIYEIINK